MAPSLEVVLAVAIPSGVGAFIGFITNAVAIRMLFRPLREWRVFGIRVPLTPGVIPRGRHELARNIGRMVAAELITSDLFVRRLQSDDFRRRLIVSGIGRRLVGMIGEDSTGAVPAVIGGLARAASRPPLRGILVDAGRSLVDDVVDGLTPVRRLIVLAGGFSAGLKERMPELVDLALSRLEKAAEDPLKRVRVAEALSQADGVTDETIVDIGIRLAVIGLPRFLAAIDLEKAVVEKIDSLGMLEVERLVLVVIARHLKWINLFGAVLGAILGSLQGLGRLVQ